MTNDYHAAVGDVGRESERLAYLAEVNDPYTFAVLDRVGIGAGWDCWEAGAGTGSVSGWLADRVGVRGSVWSTDIELDHHQLCGGHVKVESHDLVNGLFPRERFDLIHARAVLQHIPERNEILAKMVQALKPGGYLVVEDMDMTGFAAQPLAEPYGAIHRLLASGAYDSWRDANFGMKVLDLFRENGLVELDAMGRVWSMRPHEPSGEWWFRILDRAFPMLARARLVNDAEIESALDQVRHEEFVMLSPLWISSVGRRIN